MISGDRSAIWMSSGTGRGIRSPRRILASVRGFTLLELLVSLTILAAMAGMLFGSFRMSAKAWNRGEQAAEGAQRFRIMADLMRRQLSCAYSLDVRQLNNPMDPNSAQDSPGRPQLPGGMLPQRVMTQNGGVPFFKGTMTGLKFTGLYPLRPHENTGMLLIDYTVEGASDGSGYLLLERESRYLGSEFLRNESLFLGGQAIRSNVVFEKLQEARFQYFGVDPLSGAASWEDSWDSEIKDGLPKAVALDIILNEEIGRMGMQHRFLVPIVAESFRSRNRRAVEQLFQSSAQQP
jgi:prepilin-type N-terminal cleavage/methylation domain-containing protein